MLTGCALDTRAAHGKACPPPLWGLSARALQDIFYIAVSGFIRNGRHGARLENMGFAEKFFREPVRLRLKIAAEIQVDIRLFIAVKPKESFKRDLMAVPVHRFAADGAVFRRQIKA